MMNIVDSINSILSFLDGQNPLTHQLAELFSCCKITHFFSFRTYFFVIFFRGSVWLIFSMIFLYFILIKSIQGGIYCFAERKSDCQYVSKFIIFSFRIMRAYDLAEPSLSSTIRTANSSSSKLELNKDITSSSSLPSI